MRCFTPVEYPNKTRSFNESVEIYVSRLLSLDTFHHTHAKTNIGVKVWVDLKVGLEFVREPNYSSPNNYKNKILLNTLIILILALYLFFKSQI